MRALVLVLALLWAGVGIAGQMTREKGDGYKPAAAYAHEMVKPGDVVLVDGDFGYWCFMWYFDGPRWGYPQQAAIGAVLLTLQGSFIAQSYCALLCGALLAFVMERPDGYAFVARATRVPVLLQALLDVGHVGGTVEDREPRAAARDLVAVYHPWLALWGYTRGLVTKPEGKHMPRNGGPLVIAINLLLVIERDNATHTPANTQKGTAQTIDTIPLGGEANRFRDVRDRARPSSP